MARTKKATEPLVTDDLTDPRYEQPHRPAAVGTGRPKGSKTVDRPEAVLRPAACPSCRSTRRAPFRDGPLSEMRITMQVGGETYNRLLWRNTKCLDCGQQYRVIEYRFEPNPEPESEKQE